MGKNGLHGIAIVLMCCISSQLIAGPIGLPDSARPGAVRPDADVTSTVPKSPQGEVMEIPAVIDRPFDIDEGEKVAVDQFRLLNAKDLPDYDISLAEIEALLTQIRESRPEGFTIGRLQEVADQVTRYYREKGLILAQAVVPVQTVEGGVVDIQVFEGVLGRVLVESNELYTEDTLRKPFNKLIGKPVTKDEVEAALLTLTDYPGLTVFGVFQPGIKVGTADIVLKVQEEKRFDVAYRVDTHGTQETGRYRFRTTIDWNNLFSASDKITFTLQQSYRPKESFFKSMEYQRHFLDSYLAGIFWNTNKFDVAGEFKRQQISAETENTGAYIEKSFIRSRQENLSARFGMTRKESISKQRARIRSREILGVVNLSMDYDSVDRYSIFPFFDDEEDEDGFQTGGINFVSLELTQGFNNFLGGMGSHTDATELPAALRPSRQGGSGEFASGEFTKLFGTFSRLQTLAPRESLLIRAEVQWSDDLLVPAEQYSIGGPENVRAYPSAHQLMDRAWFASFEYIINAPFIADRPAFGNRTWGEVLQFSVFYDIAVGRLNDPLNSEESTYENYKGLGFGFRFNLPGSLDSRLMWAWAVDAPNSGDVGNDRRPQFWGDLTYSF